MSPLISISVDPQHGPIVTVEIDGKRVSVYLADETAIFTTETGQYGVEVQGPWYEFRHWREKRIDC